MLQLVMPKQLVELVFVLPLQGLELHPPVTLQP